MRSTFFGLNIGYKALQAQRRALDITSHNIANANTQGYTRQDVIMQASTPAKVVQGYVGTGVDIVAFRRIRDEFLDIQLRTENKSLGEWETRADILSKLEVVFNEPSEAGLRSVMDSYFESWQQLSKNPESTAVRATVVQRGVALAETLNHMDRLFGELQFDINQSIKIRVDEINFLGRQVRDLNNQIVKAEAGGYRANDLRDKRDLLVEQLSKIVDIGVVEDNLGAVNITIGGSTLVSRSYLGEIKFTDNESDPSQAALQWIDAESKNVIGQVRVKGGILKGYLDMRDQVIGGPAGLKNKINQLATGLANEINTLHGQGQDLESALGIPFFISNDSANPNINAKNIQINPAILNNLNKIAAATPANPLTNVIKGDGSNALSIAQLKNRPTINGGKSTFDDFYRATVAQLGVDAQEAERMADNQALLVNQLLNKREAVSGVSLDEEMSNMIRFQHAYTAAARIINTMDEMLDTIVNRLGTVGR